MWRSGSPTWGFNTHSKQACRQSYGLLNGNDEGRARVMASNTFFHKQRLSPRQQAIRWLLRIKDAPLGDAETREFKDWCAVEENAIAFSKARALSVAIAEIS